MPKRRSHKRSSGIRSVAANSNPGVISTGDNTRITINQHKQKPRRPQRIIYGEIPRQPPAFQPRDDLRNQLLNAGRLAIISTLAGTRGIGKSQLAAAYARECINDGWPLVAWIGAERSDQVLADLGQLSRAIGLHEDTDDAVSAAYKVRRWLEDSRGGRHLIVFDNASDPDSLARWLPSTGSAQVLITSNRRSFEHLGTLIDVEAFTPGEARTYLFESTGLRDEAGADALAEEVGRLPLALAQASAVVKSQRLSYSEFLDRLRKVPLDKYLERQPGDAYPRRAAETVLLAVEEAERRGGVIPALMLLLSVLSPDGVARGLLYSAPIGRGVMKWLLSGGRKLSRASVDEALEIITEASLATFSVDGQTVIMHRFTQRVVRDRADKSGIYALILIRVSKFIAAQRNLGDSSVEQGEIREHLIKQISSLWDNVGIKSPADIDGIVRNAGFLGRLLGRQFAKWLMDLRIWSVEELNRTGNYSRAIELGTSVVRDCQTLLGADHPDTLRSRIDLAAAYLGAGRVDEAIGMLQVNIADHERVLGPDHPDTLRSRTDLAAAYRGAGRVDEAIDMHQRTLADHERVLGPDHPGTLNSRHNLASTYLDAGRVDEAIDMHQRTLADHERVLGPNHLGTLSSRSNLAVAYLDAGRVDEAIGMLQVNLADCERVLGPDHPGTLSTRHNLALAYLDAGRRVDEAMDMLQRTLADRERVLGRDHPDTLISRRHLHFVYQQRTQRGRSKSEPRSRRRP